MNGLLMGVSMAWRFHLKSPAREWLAARRVQTLLPGIRLVAIPCFSVLQNTPVRTRASTSACVPPLLVVSEDRPALSSLGDRCQGVAVGDADDGGGSPNVRQWAHPVIRTISCTGEGAGRGIDNIKNCPLFSFSHIDPFWKLFRNWCACVHAMRGQTGELLEPMARVARMFEGHWEGFSAHWTQGLTSAFMGGLNSLFSDVER